ncbi:hypothetical protein [Variovorax robiniae]|uniref:hypothetical protein n=1 Tax=Variovorax robiniae TaxID=1836199 RepID=UPI003BF530A5
MKPLHCCKGFFLSRAPMPARDNPGAVYDVFTVRNGEQIFLAAVSDAQWLLFCDGPKAGETVKTTLFPITLEGHRLGVRLSPPKLGEHSTELLRGMGCTDAEIADMRVRGIVS